MSIAAASLSVKRIASYKPSGNTVLGSYGYPAFEWGSLPRLFPLSLFLFLHVSTSGYIYTHAEDNPLLSSLDSQRLRAVCFGICHSAWLSSSSLATAPRRVASVLSANSLSLSDYRDYRDSSTKQPVSGENYVREFARLWQRGEETKGNGGKSGRGNDGKAAEERANGQARGREERLTFLCRLNIVVSCKGSLCHEAIRKNPLFICASCRWHYGRHHSEKRGSSWIGMKSVCTV